MAGSRSAAPPSPDSGVVLNVKQCGAIGDGVTDDTAAIQRAVTELQSRGGGTLLYPPGTYLISQQGTSTAYGTTNYCVYQTGSNIFHLGMGATVKIKSGSGSRSICALLIGDAVNPVTNVIIEGITFDGNAINLSDGSVDGNHIIPSQTGGAAIYGSDDFNAGVLVRGPFTAAANFPNVNQQVSAQITLRNCQFYRWSNAAAKLYCYTDEVTIQGCLFDGEGIWANVLMLDGVRNSYIAGNRLLNLIPLLAANAAIPCAFNGDTGIRPHYGNTFIGNHIENIQGGGAGISGVLWNCTVIGNTIVKTGNWGINLGKYDFSSYHYGSQNTIVAGNTLTDCRFGILLDGSATTAANATGNIIANNVVYNDTATTKSALDYSAGAYITRTWTSCAVGIDMAAGVVAACTRNLISGNRLQGMSSFIIRDNTTGANTYWNNDISTESLGASSLTLPATAIYRTLTDRIVTKTADYSVTTADTAVVMNAASKTVTLPSAATAGAGRQISVTNGASGSSTTVTATSGTFSGASSVTLAAAYAALRVISDGTNWVILSQQPLAPQAHASTHLPGASDALSWTTVHATGTHAARPTAAAGNAGVIYLETDTGFAYLSDGATWNQFGGNSSSAPNAHSASHQRGGTDDLYLDSGLDPVPTVAQENVSRLLCQATPNAIANDVAYLGYFRAKTNLTISQLACCTGTLATIGTITSRMGLYTIDGSNNATLVARTAQSTTITKSTATVYTLPLDTTGGYPATYALVAGSLYAFGFIVSGASTLPRMAGPALIPTGLAAHGQIMSKSNTQTTPGDLPTSIPNASGSNGAGVYLWMEGS